MVSKTRDRQTYRAHYKTLCSRVVATPRMDGIVVVVVLNYTYDVQRKTRGMFIDHTDITVQFSFSIKKYFN